MRVLVACEESGAVRDAFRAMGHDAWSCDLQECSGDPEFHILGDIRDLLSDPWFDSVDLLCGHPPCTFLANSGVRWLYNDDGSANTLRWAAVAEAESFFSLLLDCGAPRICIENPIPHGHAGLPPYTQCIQPWMFGDNYSKATCLWLRNLLPLVPQVLRRPEHIVHACHMEPPGPDRQKNRSKTYPGIAAAMAEQWGGDWVPELRLINDA